jgi:ferrous iron transport protein A
MKTSLETLIPGETGTVVGYHKGLTVSRERLLAMGLTHGAELTVERVAPLGDPVEITVRGFALSLRKDEAAAVLVEKQGHV